MNRSEKLKSLFILLVLASTIFVNSPEKWWRKSRKELRNTLGEGPAAIYRSVGLVLGSFSFITGLYGVWAMFDTVPRDAAWTEIVIRNPDGSITPYQSRKVPYDGGAADFFHNDHWGTWHNVLPRNRELRQAWFTERAKSLEPGARFEVAARNGLLNPYKEFAAGTPAMYDIETIVEIYPGPVAEK